MFDWILARAKEPSTWAGLGGVAAGVGISNEVFTAVGGVVAAVAGLVAVVLAEKAKKAAK